ncbi:hypothetical protein EVAR_49392_1 [Eumeta japonica]|uniref:Uncharacterized protein n=1 Tax=Eumeta variegata TaxID=151549 RepID=A0A4C1YQC0_EUMVA|nr:hypothetical protein EVAR_49392_1 [Eumeta japonica]
MARGMRFNSDISRHRIFCSIPDCAGGGAFIGPQQQTRQIDTMISGRSRGGVVNTTFTMIDVQVCTYSAHTAITKVPHAALEANVTENIAEIRGSSQKGGRRAGGPLGIRLRDAAAARGDVKFSFVSARNKNSNKGTVYTSPRGAGGGEGRARKIARREYPVRGTVYRLEPKIELMCAHTREGQSCSLEEIELASATSLCRRKPIERSLCLGGVPCRFQLPFDCIKRRLFSRRSRRAVFNEMNIYG